MAEFTDPYTVAATVLDYGQRGQKPFQLPFKEEAQVKALKTEKNKKSALSSLNKSFERMDIDTATSSASAGDSLFSAYSKHIDPTTGNLPPDKRAEFNIASNRLANIAANYKTQEKEIAALRSKVNTKGYMTDENRKNAEWYIDPLKIDDPQIMDQAEVIKAGLSPHLSTEERDNFTRMALRALPEVKSLLQVEAETAPLTADDFQEYTAGWVKDINAQPYLSEPYRDEFNRVVYKSGTAVNNNVVKRISKDIWDSNPEVEYGGKVVRLQDIPAYNTAEKYANFALGFKAKGTASQSASKDAKPWGGLRRDDDGNIVMQPTTESVYSSDVGDVVDRGSANTIPLTGDDFAQTPTSKAISTRRSSDARSTVSGDKPAAGEDIVIMPNAIRTYIVPNVDFEGTINGKRRLFKAGEPVSAGLAEKLDRAGADYSYVPYVAYRSTETYTETDPETGTEKEQIYRNEEAPLKDYEDVLRTSAAEKVDAAYEVVSELERKRKNKGNKPEDSKYGKYGGQVKKQ